MFDPNKFLIEPSRSIADAITLIDANGSGIVVVVDEEKRPLGTVTDGDVRRAILRHVDLDARVDGLLLDPTTGAHRRAPVIEAAGTDETELLSLMRRRGIRHVPLVDAAGHVVDVAIFERLAEETIPRARAVVMAGGQGTRLRPLTLDTPKPMLPVGNQPLMERLVGNLRDAGIRTVHVATHYRPEKIRAYFGTGAAHGVELNYVSEEEPLGTAGALRLVEAGSEPLIVVNGDIVTNVNFRALIAFHHEARATMTVGVRRYEINVPYGVVETDGAFVTSLVEKPSYQHFVNAGIYVVEPTAISHIPHGRRFDMTDLIRCLIADGERVASFPVREYWLDIGRPEDYARAQQDHESGALE